MMLPQQLTSVYVAILNSQLEWPGLSVVSYSVSHVPVVQVGGSCSSLSLYPMLVAHTVSLIIGGLGIN
jgi:hypothetical protein